jgi:hypothetical protein
MKTNTKIGLILVLLVSFLLFSGQPSVRADDTDSGGVQQGRLVRETWKVHQNKYDDFATDLHFKIWQEEDNIDINGWEVEVGHFTSLSSQRGNQPEPQHSKLKNLPGLPKTNDPDNGQHAVDATAEGANIPKCTWVKVEAKFWLTHWNTKRIEASWTKEAQPEQKAVPNHGWEIDWPVKPKTKDIPIPDSAPPYPTPEGTNPPKDGDINGDNQPDWLFDRQVDDQGNDIELWVVDPDGKENAGTKADPYDEYYALLFSNATGKYFIGKCPFGAGRNNGEKYHTGDTNGNGKIDQFTGTRWRSEDGGEDDEGSAPGRDAWEYTFDPKSGKVIETHYDKDGNVIGTPAIKEPEKWQSPGDFNDLDPVILNFSYYDGIMEVGEIMIPEVYYHKFTITNDDTIDNLTISGLAFLPTMDWYDNLMNITFPSPYPNFTLLPGESWYTNITTSGPLYGGHIYFKYNITGSEIISQDWVDHPVTEPPGVVMRDLPGVALMPNETYPGDTFDVYVNFTSPGDDLNSIGLTDLAPDGWAVQVNETWCWIDGSPASALHVNALGNKAEIMLAGPFAAGKNISVMYKVTVPTTATPGLNEWPVCPDMDEAGLEYYFGEDGPYKSCISGEYQMVITVPGDIVGETRDVNANELPDVEVQLYLAGTGYLRSDISTPQYVNTANVTGTYWLVGNLTRWYELNITDGVMLPGAGFDIDLSTPALLAAGNTFDFEGDYGLIPRACTMSYALKAINLWKIGCAANPEYDLSEWKAMDVCNSWLYPS